MSRRQQTLLLASFLSLTSLTYAQEIKNTNHPGQAGYQPSASNLEARKRFRDHGFGIFIHWGLYSNFAQGEWYLHNANINYREYAKSAAGFYPANFDAKRWIEQIKASGAGYICITSRHHDSFSMWDTKYSNYNIVQATPFKRDILAELRDECRRQGLGFHIYYSLLDWAREDYTPIGKTGKGTGRQQYSNWDSYDTFMNNQLSELASIYDADAIWLDGHWDQSKTPDFNWHYPKMYSNIHQLKPSCLIGNNHHEAPIEGEDFQMFERDVPGANTAGLSGQEVSNLPLETCQTMNGMWGYKIIDQNYKSADSLIRLLVQTAGRNANLLLNIGPEGNGNLPEMAVQRLNEIGTWLKNYAPTVKNGVRGGIIPPQQWGVSTQKGDRLYLHILNHQELKLNIPLREKVISAKSYDDQEAIKYKQHKGILTLHFPKAPSLVNPTDYIVELRLRKK